MANGVPVESPMQPSEQCALGVLVGVMCSQARTYVKLTGSIVRAEPASGTNHGSCIMHTIWCAHMYICIPCGRWDIHTFYMGHTGNFISVHRA